MELFMLLLDTIVLVIMTVVVISGVCVMKVIVSSTLNRRSINKYMAPAFPCDGILFVLAGDGLLYAVPKGVAVIKTDRVREVHCGRIVRSCDNNGYFTYFDDFAHGEDFTATSVFPSNDSDSDESLSRTASLSEDSSDNNLSWDALPGSGLFGVVTDDSPVI